MTFKWIATVLITAVGALASYAFTSNLSAHDTRLTTLETIGSPAVRERLTKVETLREEDSKRLERMENKMDHIITDLDGNGRHLTR